MTNTEDHEKMSKTTLLLAGYLRVMREDVAWMTDRVMIADAAGGLTDRETGKLILILDELQHDIASLRERLRERGKQ